METLDSTEVKHENYEYGGFWIRFVAAIIDGIVLQLVGWPLKLMLGLDVQGWNPEMGFNYDIIAYNSGISILIQWLYYAFMESSPYQGTLGKMALGLKVIDEEGERISFVQATGRFFSKILSALILLIGYMMAGWDAKKQALHDKLAKTYVIRK